jgi:hypothetical protein
LASLTCSARPPNSGWTALASRKYIKLEIVDGPWLAVDDTFSPEPPSAPQVDPGAPADEEMRAAWGAWSRRRATELRAALQSAIRAGDDGVIVRVKQAVGVALAEHPRSPTNSTA